MRRRVAGRTGILVSELGFGCSSFWAKPVFPEPQALALVDAAIGQGITFFDTGPSYAGGTAERRLGIALARHGASRELVVATKVGTHLSRSGRRYKDWSPRAVRDSLHRSLERLGRDHVDFLHLHGPQIGDLTPELVGTLCEFRQAGLTRAIGINSFDERVLRAGLQMPEFDSFMLEYNVIKKHNAPLIDEIAASGRAVLVGTPVAQALFTANVFNLVHLKNAWALLRALRHHRQELAISWHYRFLNRIPGLSGPQIALAYVLRHPRITTAIFGTTDPRHLAENIAAAEIDLAPTLVARIDGVRDGYAMS